ncbi:restriction endonuclease [Candidatus Kaiserbacteria bacterium]|nr:restriction endonuclease [Candidatus Kaiserbacteria bacterium]
MSIPDYQSLMLAVLSASAEGEVRIAETTEHLADKLGLTPEERAELLPSGKQTVFSNRVHWAKFYLGKAGLIESPRRGYFAITDRGRRVLDAKPERIDNKLLNQFDEFKNFVRGSSEAAENDGLLAAAAVPEQTKTPDEVMRAAYLQIEASLAQELLDRVRSAPPDFFERLIVNLLLSMGFGASVTDAGRALGRSGDDGVDGVIDQDALGLDRVYIQAKRYKDGNTVGSGAIRDFFGSLNLHKATKGLFVTTSSFSSSAATTAASLSTRIVLVDGEQLAKLMIRHNVGCRIEDTLHIKKIDEDFFE